MAVTRNNPGPRQPENPPSQQRPEEENPEPEINESMEDEEDILEPMEDVANQLRKEAQKKEISPLIKTTNLLKAQYIDINRQCNAKGVIHENADLRGLYSETKYNLDLLIGDAEENMAKAQSILDKYEVENPTEEDKEWQDKVETINQVQCYCHNKLHCGEKSQMPRETVIMPQESFMTEETIHRCTDSATTQSPSPRSQEPFDHPWFWRKHDVVQNQCHCESSQECHRKMSMNIREFCSNEPLAFTQVPQEDMAQDEETKLLGVRWNTKIDCLHNQLHTEPPLTFTKRTIASTIAKTFDPMGYFAPLQKLSDLKTTVTEAEMETSTPRDHNATVPKMPQTAEYRSLASGVALMEAQLFCVERQATENKKDDFYLRPVHFTRPQECQNKDRLNIVNSLEDRPQAQNTAELATKVHNQAPDPKENQGCASLEDKMTIELVTKEFEQCQEEMRQEYLERFKAYEVQDHHIHHRQAPHTNDYEDISSDEC